MYLIVIDIIFSCRLTALEYVIGIRLYASCFHMALHIILTTLKGMCFQLNFTEKRSNSQRNYVTYPVSQLISMETNFGFKPAGFYVHHATYGFQFKRAICQALMSTQDVHKDMNEPQKTLSFTQKCYKILYKVFVLIF